uniref:Family with sequence similarity 83 member E n=1 Tax=Neogobius melanostomus TaxID=47308 RepID=A0A8C6SZP4_9GOBI
MTDSQEQCLNEDIVFLPVSETSPEFLYSEPERLAVERLLNAGPEAFYSTVGAGQSSCFLSPDEVTEITNWAQDYHLSPHPKEENGEFGQGLDFGGYSSTYYPAHSDTPAPCLALGWPESSPWRREDSVRVYTSPPAEGEPSVRELIRRKLQTATQVCLIMLCIYDCAVIGDLHNAASRGVPVYIIINQRSAQENTLVRLRHPNIQVRVLGGKSFCSRAGRMVAGEMRSKFVLVDLQTVIHGSYRSASPLYAHLHRQLVTVLTGSVVDSFDHEFRILFAASSPVPEPRIGSCGQISNHLNNFSDTWFPKHLPFLDTEITNPPSSTLNRFSGPPPPTSPTDNNLSHLLASHR